MNKTWYCYVMFSVGLMLLTASDDVITADDKQSAHQITFGSEREVEIHVNKDGDSDAQVELSIDGKIYAFAMPDGIDGEDQVITTEDGKTITIKSMSGNKMLFVDGNQLHLPSLSNQEITTEGLSAMIGRSHHVKMSNDVSLVADGLSDDVKNAIVEAVKGVLASYNVKKKVSVRENNVGMHFISADGKTSTGTSTDKHKFFEFKIDGDISKSEIHGKGMQVITIDTLKEETEDN
ncbi:MAG: hypothetical protein ACI9N9_002958 [Enterobacterales bacterium]|jgi:hypothetical protein